MAQAAEVAHEQSTSGRHGAVLAIVGPHTTTASATITAHTVAQPAWGIHCPRMGAVWASSLY